MNVLGLVSSPRRLGNSELCVKEMMNILPSDWEKQMIRISGLQIRPCRAYNACLAKGARCVQDDDLEFLLSHIRKADKVILSAPCYMLGTHAPVKMATDRFFSAMSDFEDYEGKECALIVNYGQAGGAGIAREDMMMFAHALNLTVVGDMMLNATMPGDCLKPGNLELLHQLARKLVHSEDAFITNSGELLCPVCESRLIRLSPDARWKCASCDVGGRLAVEEGHIIFNVDAPEEGRFSLRHRSDHQAYLNHMAGEFLKRKDAIKAVKASYRQDDLWVAPDHEH